MLEWIVALVLHSRMKTRSHKTNVGYDRDSDSDESVYERVSRRRERKELNLPGRKLDVGYRDALDLNVSLRYSSRRRASRTQDKMRQGHHSSETQDKKPSTSLSMMDPSPSSSNQAYANGDNSVDDKKMVRRSTRQRKFTYDNLNQAWLVAPSFPEYSKLESLFISNSQQGMREDGDDQFPQLRRSERNRNSHELSRLATNSDSMEFDDMYSRVKRDRRKSVHDFYSRRMQQDGGMADTEDTDQNGLSDSDTIDDHSDLGDGIVGAGPTGAETVNSIKYSLRPKKPITERFQFPIRTVRPRRSAQSNMFDSTDNARHHRRPRERETFKSTAHMSPMYRRKRHAIHNSSSTSSSSDDERRFEKRKARSMARARNRCLPINFNEEDLNTGVMRDRMKIGSSLADIDPMGIDKSVTFERIGGLDRHIQALKEIVLFPLMYPEVFQKFKITPPRGVLFHGQPGTGKTLVARALANECSNNDRRVSFFMRKGADCLSKWVGESERQLRLLFDQAYSMRPSIIFFDEIDGLAPVRSTRQDQIHSSIVSTLLALMDGLDNRGEIIIIGATNRIDAIDPALRRPGRFDREMIFPLPPVEARLQILKIHMREWNPPQPEALITQLAAQTVGYCGADLKALCTETALVALRGRYPQIYRSKQKLQLDVSSIQVSSKDFFCAMKKMRPSVQRTSVFSPKPLPVHLKPLLDGILHKAMNKLKSVFPVGCNTQENTGAPSTSHNFSGLVEDVSSDESEAIFSGNSSPKPPNGPNVISSHDVPSSHQSLRHSLWPFVHRPRFLLCGEKGQGQGTLAPAVLHLFEHVPVHRLDIPALYAVTCRAPEEACAQVFQEAHRSLPSIIFLPHVGCWWETLAETVRATFLSLLEDIEPNTPLLLLATSDCKFIQLPCEVQEIFGTSEEKVMHMENPDDECRKKFFSQLKQEILIVPKSKSIRRGEEELMVAPTPPPRQLTSEELAKLRQKEEATLRELRLFLRDILNKLARDNRFKVFSRPVDPSEVPDYEEVIKNPMDLETMMYKIDHHQYETVSQFLSDIDLVCQNALEYNPDRDPSGKLIRHRACALKDIAHALVLTELDNEFEQICVDIQKARKERGEITLGKKPTLPKPRANTATYNAQDMNSMPEDIGMKDSTTDSLPNSYPTRYSKRIRGLSTLPDCDDNKEENLPVPRRAVRYMIWRRKKSPWFGSCRRKLIRQKVTLNGVPEKKYIERPKILPSVAPRTLRHQKDNIPMGLPRQRSSSNSPLKEQKTLLSTHKSTSDLLLTQVSDVEMMDSSPDKSSKEDNGKYSKHSPGLRKEDKYSTSASNCLSSCDIFVDNQSSKKLPAPELPLKCDVGPLPGIQHTLNVLEAKKSSASAKALLSPRNAVRACPKQEIVVDKSHLQLLFDRVVKITDGCTVEALQHFFSQLQQCVYRHRKECNKEKLLSEFEKELQRFWLHKRS